MEKEYWVLRSGDFRPELLDESNSTYGPRKHAIETLYVAGNLFESEQDAIEASIAVRSELHRLIFIRQERREYERKRRNISQPLTPQ